MNDLLDNFKAWCSQHSKILHDSNVSAEVVINDNIEKRSCYFELVSDKYCARITFWETGEAFKQLINIESMSDVIVENLLIDNNNFDNYFGDIIGFFTLID